MEEQSQDVAPEKALSICLADQPFFAKDTQNFVAKDGSEIILDIDEEGLVCGIEFV